MSAAVSVRGIAFRSGKKIVIVCLDHYLVTSCEDEQQIPQAIQAMVQGHIEVSEELGRMPFEGLPSAPERYWEMYRKLERERVEAEKAARSGQTIWNWIPPRVTFAPAFAGI